jgi:two-component system OmpR family response regulator
MADRKHTIIVVEDDPNIRLLIKITLANDALDVYEASNGAEALHLMKKQKVDLVISDVAMPVMDGYELVDTLKGASDTANIPVLMLTARQSNSTPHSHRAYSADDYLQKPFNIDDLVKKVDSLLSSA